MKGLIGEEFSEDESIFSFDEVGNACLVREPADRCQSSGDL